MAQVTLKGNPINTCGDLPAVGSKAPDFKLVAGDLSVQSLGDFAGKTIVMNIVPSFDTGTCAMSVKAFNEKAGSLGDTQVVNVSMDLPFAQKRFCEENKVEHVTNLSCFRCSQFGKDYGIALVDGPLEGLMGRAVVVINASGEVVYSQLVPEIADEPNYDAAIEACAQTA